MRNAKSLRLVQNGPVKFLSRLAIAALILTSSVGPFAFQQRFQGRIDEEEEGPPLPVDIHEKAEWAFARFHFHLGTAGYGYHSWAADYPKADRQFVAGLRRLTRINARAMEQVVDASSDDLFNWPWIYEEHAGGGWDFSDEEAARMREYLVKGGFLFADDSHGDYEWEGLIRGLRKIFPDREIEDLNDNDEIFHTVYDLDERFQIRGTRFVWGGRSYGPDMKMPKWRAIRDDKGRVMVAICHNSDVGDAWEWADSPNYPEKETSLAYRIGINYIVYSLTH